MSRVQSLHIIRKWLIPAERPAGPQQFGGLEGLMECFPCSLHYAYNVCSLASMEAYARQIGKLNTQLPRCWGLIYLADDGARAERLEND